MNRIGWIALPAASVAAIAIGLSGNSDAAASVVALASPTATTTPTPTPTPHATIAPTLVPTSTPSPTAIPTLAPTATPTSTPTNPPTLAPTATPTPSATQSPSASPPLMPAASALPRPTATPPPTPTPPAGAQRQTLGTANSTTLSVVNPQCNTTLSRPTQPLLQSGEVLVGWNFPQGPRCGVVYRSGVWFRDLPKNVQVVDATLTFYVSRSQSSSQGAPLTGNVSCASQLQIASSMWMNNPNNPTSLLGTPYLTLVADRPGDTQTFGPFSIANGMFVSIDVTSAVRQWVSGAKPNFGFVLLPDRADFSGGAGHCFSAYSGFTLTVDTP